MCARLALLTLLLAHLQLPRSAAQAPALPIVWVDARGELASAARAGFAASDLVLVRGESPGVAIDPSELARERAASAIVWTSRAAGQTDLHVYDAARQRIVATRRLTNAPLDAAAAAAVVLSVKTYLGLPKGNAPESSSQPASAATTQLLAAQSAASEPFTQAEPEPAHDLVARPRADSAADSGRANAAPELPTRARLSLAAVGGMRAALQHADPELRYGIAVDVRVDRAWDVALELSAGTGFHWQATQLFEPAAALLGSWHIFDSARWELALVAGPALHWLWLRVQSAQSAQRLRPHLYSGLRLTWHAASGWFVGALVNADVALIAQRYWIGQELTQEARTVGVRAALMVGMPLRF